jgi:hypothetical protein
VIDDTDVVAREPKDDADGDTIKLNLMGGSSDIEVAGSSGRIASASSSDIYVATRA